MIDLESREIEIMKSLKDFQRATANRVIELFTSGQHRVLVADEVGLGKTLVAKGVIAGVAQLQKSKNDDLFRVVYICSNQSIAQQNIRKLKIDKEVNVDNDSSTRLTMQTLKYFKQKNDPKYKNAFVLLTPLTPNTSFATTSGRGIKDERALIFAILKRIPIFSKHTQALSDLLSMGVNDWKWYSTEWVEGAINECGDEYIESVIPKVEAELNSDKYRFLQDNLLRACEAITGGADPSKYGYQLVHNLRRLMADISISYLEPDLVIMDEFQRFRELIRTNEDSEIGMLARKFLKENECKVLLLSATPYKLYSTLEEIEENNGTDDYYKEFHEVVTFLYGDNSEMRDAFRKAWGNYTNTLKQINRVSQEEYQYRKSVVEDLLYSVICRTERLQVTETGRDIVSIRNAKPLEIKLSDIAAYIASDQIVQKLSSLGKTALPPVEYVKSSPYILSFMENYQLKKLLKRHKNDLLPTLKKHPECWVPRESIEQYESIAYPNARLNRLMEEAFTQNGENLLWIPPALPYYQMGGPFKGSEGFSKILVFSAWEMVPRMIASLVSYEAERRTIGDPSYQPKSDLREKVYTPIGDQRRFPARKLDFRATVNRDGLPDSMSLFALLYPGITLVELFNPVEFQRNYVIKFPVKRRSLERHLKDSLKPLLDNLIKYQSTTSGRKDASWYWVAPLLLDIERYGRDQVASWVSGLKQTTQQKEEDQDNSRDGQGKHYNDHLDSFEHIAQNPESLRLGAIPDDLIDVLMRQTLGSPAICALRMLSQELPNDESRFSIYQTAFIGAYEIANALRSKLNTPEATAIVDRCYRAENDFHWKNVLRYGVDGNLQAIFDEYSHLLRDSNALHELDSGRRIEDLAKLISQSLRTYTASYKVDTLSAFTSRSKDESKSLRMRSHYAAAFTNVKSENEQTVQRTDQLRQSFNSPFWPFVLASTSIGQEGLDFHLYCRKICHWNLPANPIDLEQREGRVNRYKSHALRYNVVQRYHMDKGTVITGRVWDDLFDLCKSIKQENQCELIPYWYIEPADDHRSHGYIERIVPMYPFSKDEAHYERLISILSLYRITMGQPRQEELLDAIAQYICKEDQKTVQEWFIQLSPYYHGNNACNSLPLDNI